MKPWRTGRRCGVVVGIAVVLSAHLLWASSVDVVDSLGRVVTVKVPVERAAIVSTTELIPALDIWDRVVGVSRCAEEDCDLHRAFIEGDPSLRRPKVGEGMDVNVEAVIGVHPQLVITWAVFPLSVRFLEERGIPTVALQPESITEVYETIRLHGVMFDRRERAEEIVKEMERVFAMIRKRTADIAPEERKRVMVTWMRPTTVNGNRGVLQEVMAIIGAQNVAAEIEQRTADVPVERIIEWDPEVIFTWGYANYGPEWFLKGERWGSLRAVRRAQVYKLPLWPTTSPRLPLFALFMAMRLYPERFGGVHFDEVVDRFYRDVFGITLEKVTHHAR